jgi:poly(A) polymerase
MDIVCVGSGVELAQRVASKMKPTPRVVVYKRFGTAMLKHSGIELEFVGARKESYRYDSRKPSIEEGSLEDDQNRRDFTINALAVSLNTNDFGQIIDPFDGLRDLENKIIRTPLEPGKTFSDDPLRMMRALRFATQLHFKIEEETLRAIARYKNRIHIVSRERITTEMEKILMADQPSKGFKLLFDTGLLSIIFPELAAMQGVEIPGRTGT